jgi:hypothetical protein
MAGNEITLPDFFNRIDPIADMLLCTFSDGSVLATSSISGVIFSPPCFGFDRI